MNLSEIIHAYRAGRPDEWTLDEWVKKATVLEKRIAELEKVHQWISVEDRLPDDGDYVLTASPYKASFGYNGCVINTHIYSERDWFNEGAGEYESNIITHWMPLPTPPSEDK